MPVIRYRGGTPGAPDGINKEAYMDYGLGEFLIGALAMYSLGWAIYGVIKERTLGDWFTWVYQKDSPVEFWFRTIVYVVTTVLCLAFLIADAFHYDSLFELINRLRR